MSVMFREKSVGQHGANIFYKEFSVLTDADLRTYTLGSFCFVQKLPYPVTIAEFQLIWKNTYTNKKYACVKLYFDPENEEEDDDEDGFLEEWGNDEVIEANRQVVIECCELPYWECSAKLWNENIGRPAYADICKDYIKRLYKKEDVVTLARENMSVKIISYPQYCRYMTCMKMMKMGVPMTYKVFLARGGLQLDNLNTIILFSRGKFTKLRIDEFSLTRNITIPVFKGRPRKKIRKELMLLKKKKQKKLLKEVKKWKLESTKRKYTKRAHKDVSPQDVHSSVNSAASRIINKYKKKNDKTESTTKKEGVTLSTTEADMPKPKYSYVKKKERKPDDGRLMINKLKKAALLHNNEIGKNETSNVESEGNTEDELVNQTNGKGDLQEGIKKEDEDVKLFSNNTETEPVFDSNEEFTKELYSIMAACGKPIVKVPSMGRAQVDLYELYKLVMRYGGYSQVTMKRQWREIYDGLGRHANDITNQATSVRKVYENLLLLYENRKRKRDGIVQEKREKDNEIKVEESGLQVPCKEEVAECKLNSSNEGKPKRGKRGPYKKNKEKRMHVRNNPQFKRINLEEQYTSDSVHVDNMEHEISQHDESFHTRDALPHDSRLQSTPTHTPEDDGTTTFTVQAGEAFKLMIQKRRGRPSKDFREQIEHLKTLNHKVEVKVFPSVGKRTRLPKWLRELNVDIVNPRRKKKYSSSSKDYVKSNGSGRFVGSKLEIPPLPKGEIPHVSHNTYAPSTSRSKRKTSNTFPDNEYVSMVAISPEEKTHGRLELNDSNKEGEKDRCEFVIQSVQSLAKSPVKYHPQEKTNRFVHYPPPPRPYTALPHSVLPYNECRPRYSCSISNGHRAPPPRYPASSSMSTSERTSPAYRKDPTSHPINNGASKAPNTLHSSYGCKITGPNIRQIIQNKKRVYTPDHRLPLPEVHREKIYIHRPPRISLHNGKPDHKLISHIPITQNISLLPARTDSNFSGNNLVFHNYVPPTSHRYNSPTSSMCKSFGGVKKDCVDATTISNPVIVEDHDEEPKPKVYILPEEYPLDILPNLPRTST